MSKNSTWNSFKENIGIFINDYVVYYPKAAVQYIAEKMYDHPGKVILITIPSLYIAYRAFMGYKLYGYKSYIIPDKVLNYVYASNNKKGKRILNSALDVTY